MKHFISCVFTVVMILVCSNSFGLTINANGYDLNESVVVGDGIEFTGIFDYVGFDFEEFDDHVILNVFNNKNQIALWWLDFGDYSFSGFNNITNMYVLGNNKTGGTIVDNFKFDLNSITLDMDNSWFWFSHKYDQHVSFYIDVISSQTTPVPEPATSLLILIGAVCFGYTRFRK